MATASYDALNDLWIGPMRGVSIEEVGGALIRYGLVAAVVVCACEVLAFSSDSDNQQLTRKSAASNVLQGHALYLVLTSFVIVVPSFLLARVTGGVLDNVPTAAIFIAVSVVVSNLYRFTMKTNAAHLRSEGERAMGLLQQRSDSAATYAALRAEYLARLREHHGRQRILGLMMLVLSGMAAAALVAWVYDQLFKSEMAPVNPFERDVAP
jgi:hypothetical protein